MMPRSVKRVAVPGQMIFPLLALKISAGQLGALGQPGMNEIIRLIFLTRITK